MDDPTITAVLGLLGGILVGFFAALIQRRFAHVEQFCELILAEIKSASEQTENIGGEFCLSKWHNPSKARVRTYVDLVDWSTRANGQSVVSACNQYCEAQVEALSYGKEEILRDLTRIFRAAKEAL